MLNRILMAGTFFLGLLLGVLITSMIFSSTYAPLRDSLRSGLFSENKLLAEEAQRAKDFDKALFHQRSLLQYVTAEKTRTFSNQKTTSDDLTTPFFLLVLGNISTEVSPTKVEAVERGHYAYLLEKTGNEEEANKQWLKSAQLMGHEDVSVIQREIWQSIQRRGLATD